MKTGYGEELPLNHPTIGLSLHVLGVGQAEVSRLAQDLGECGLVTRQETSPTCERVVRLDPELCEWLQGRSERPRQLLPMRLESSESGKTGLKTDDALDLVLEGPPDAREVSSVLGRYVSGSGPLYAIDAADVSHPDDWRRWEGWRRLLGGFGVVLTGRGPVPAATAFGGLVVAAPSVSLASARERPTRIVRLE
ncbi:MAG: hypothetical protein IT374_07335, partial [Polyangiaceae bacterium]|nr:hypothetical protein [Polyangiaceae bacterium]